MLLSAAAESDGKTGPRGQGLVRGCEVPWPQNPDPGTWPPLLSFPLEPEFSRTPTTICELGGGSSPEGSSGAGMRRALFLHDRCAGHCCPSGCQVTHFIMPRATEQTSEIFPPCLAAGPGFPAPRPPLFSQLRNPQSNPKQLVRFSREHLLSPPQARCQAGHPPWEPALPAAASLQQTWPRSSAVRLLPPSTAGPVCSLGPCAYFRECPSASVGCDNTFVTSLLPVFVSSETGTVSSADLEQDVKKRDPWARLGCPLVRPGFLPTLLDTPPLPLGGSSTGRAGAASHGVGWGVLLEHRLRDGGLGWG